MVTVIASIGALALSDVSNVTNSGTLVTVTHTAAHGLTADQYVKLANVSGITNVNGSWQIGAVSDTTWNFTATSTPTGLYTSGGDVTRDYTDPITWEDGTTGDLVTATEIRIGECYDDNDGGGFTIENFGTQLDIDNADIVNYTSASYYRVLRAFSGHTYDPTSRTGVYINKSVSETAASCHGITVTEHYFRMEHIGVVMFSYTTNSVPSTNTTVYAGVNASGANLILNGVTVDFQVGTGDTLLGFTTGAGSALYNCLAIGSNAAQVGIGVGFKIALTTDVINCVAYGVASGTGYGFWSSTGTGKTIENNISVNSKTLDFSINASNTVENNISSDDTASYSSGSTTYYTGYGPDSIFTAPTVGDFRLLPSSPAYHTGNDQSGTFTDDITGAARPTVGGWDIGVYSGVYVPGPPAAVTEVISSIGTGKDYSTVALWESATRKHLIGTNTRYIGELYDQVTIASSTEQVFQGAITDATRYRHLRNATGARYDPISDTGAKMSGNNASATADEASVLRIQESYFRLEGVGVVQNATVDDRHCDTIVVEAGAGVRLEGVFCLLEGGGGTNAFTRRMIWFRYGSGHLAQNCIVKGGTGTDGANRGIIADSNKTDILHCVAHRCRRHTGATGFGGSGTGNRCYNCMAAASDFCYDTAATFRQSHNIATDTSAIGTLAVRNVAAADIFNDASNSDYRQPAGSPGIDSALALGVEFDFTGAKREPIHERGAYNGFIYVETAKTPAQSTHRRTQLFSMVRPKDSVALYFTNNNSPLTFRGSEYTPVGGMDRAETTSVSGIEIAQLRVTGVVSSAGVTVDDLLAHAWDDAVVTEYEVNPRFPFMAPYSTNIWTLKEATFDGEAFSAVMVGTTAFLESSRTWSHTRTCPYVTFRNDIARGHACGLFRADWETADVEVETVNDDRLEVTVIMGTNSGELPWNSDTDYYLLGEATWSRGDNTGYVSIVKTVSEDSGDTSVTDIAADSTGTGTSIFTRASGSWITDGFLAGQFVTSAGFTTAANNGTWEIDTVGTLNLTVVDANDDIVTEATDVSHTVENRIYTLTFQLQTPFAIAASDAVSITPGDDHTRATCNDRFSNLANFGGSGLEPGSDITLAPPKGSYL